jgi:prophage regulatory protein
MMSDEMQMLRMRDITQLTGLSRSLIYRLITDGLFPRPVRMSARASAWPRAAVLGYIRQRAELCGVPLPPPVPAAPGKDDDTTGH